MSDLEIHLNAYPLSLLIGVWKIRDESFVCSVMSQLVSRVPEGHPIYDDLKTLRDVSMAAHGLQVH
jgi:hypothetical protein